MAPVRKGLGVVGGVLVMGELCEGRSPAVNPFGVAGAGDASAHRTGCGVPARVSPQRRRAISAPEVLVTTKGDFEEVAHYPLDAGQLAELYEAQAECTFVWCRQDGWPTGVTMNYVHRDGHFWLTATAQRPRIAAIRRDPRVAVVVSSIGTTLGMRAVTHRGRCVIRDDAETKRWFYPALAKRLQPGNPEGQAAFERLLDTARRVVIEVVPEHAITFDGNKLLSEV
jgi:nitroimidazol reductase NimA-like FMN-containing flavoprotein (pyridoxamine 5'-phosphate oxidase superfamily)